MHDIYPLFEFEILIFAHVKNFQIHYCKNIFTLTMYERLIE